MVTSFDPLEIWLYDEFYVRLCADDYNKDLLHTSGLFMSLANNSVSKYSENQKKYHENMMFMSDLDSYLKVKSN